MIGCEHCYGDGAAGVPCACGRLATANGGVIMVSVVSPSTVPARPFPTPLTRLAQAMANQPGQPPPEARLKAAMSLLDDCCMAGEVKIEGEGEASRLVFTSRRASMAQVEVNAAVGLLLERNATVAEAILGHRAASGDKSRH